MLAESLSASVFTTELSVFFSNSLARTVRPLKFKYVDSNTTSTFCSIDKHLEHAMVYDAHQPKEGKYTSESLFRLADSLAATFTSLQKCRGFQSHS